MNMKLTVAERNTLLEHGIAVGSFAFAGCRLDFDRPLMVQFRGSVVTSASECWTIANSTKRSN
jgi:hypothetical protein